LPEKLLQKNPTEEREMKNSRLQDPSSTLPLKFRAPEASLFNPYSLLARAASNEKIPSHRRPRCASSSGGGRELLGIPNDRLTEKFFIVRCRSTLV